MSNTLYLEIRGIGEGLLIWSSIVLWMYTVITIILKIPLVISSKKRIFMQMNYIIIFLSK